MVFLHLIMGVRMRKIEQVAYAASAAAVVVLSSAEAFAGTTQNSLPAPGIIGLVAGGVVAAIAVARLRKKG